MIEAETATEPATATESATAGPRTLPTSPTTAVAASTDTTLAVAALSATALPVASDRAPLGVNLEGLWDWARLQPFADTMKSSRPWGTPEAPWDEAAAVDALGWPTGDAGVVVNVRTFEPGDEGKRYRYMTPGVYRLRFTGRATVTSGSDIVIRNYVYDAVTNKSRAEVVVGPATTQLMLAFRNTNKGVRDVSLRRPDVNDTQTFTSQFVQALAPFQVVRFMDFLRTNGNPVRTWAERTEPTSGTQVTPKGAAYEYAIQLANELGKDIWINVPALADDAYVRSLALLLKQRLALGRVVYVEYSNELWNFQFSQARDNMNAAMAEAIAGDTTLTKGQSCTQALFNASSGECNPYWAGYYRVGKRTVRVARIFSEVFGAAAMNKQVRVVYATQFANPGVAEQVLKNIATYRATPSSLLYGVATAPYFYLSPELANAPAATKDQVLHSLQTSLRTEDEPFFAAGVKENGLFVRRAYTGGNFTGASHKALADYYGLKSLAYEGGPDLGQSAANGAAKIAANRDPAMGELVKSEVGQWLGCGNDLFMYFSLSSAWDRYGYWGLTNDPSDLAGAKYTAARDIANSARSAWTTCR
ncbi:hypothetical protein JJ685_12800 [Ramlibacter monticola]|uniref:Cellulose-binding protein n=1 Tax=Ramlibacter monticola TaxID=1926872 RepID=A0A937CUG8_9BURK|nr:hypothetical protein [Ramlibacter monticola]MBL0392012.1 hypothetical protein [Ramlibacter monticola]